MEAFSDETQKNKRLLVLAMPIPDQMALLFTMVFINLHELVKYVSKELRNTDTFHLVIPLDCLENFVNDPIYRFPQIRRIDVYYAYLEDLIQIQHRLNLGYGRLQFFSVYDFPRRLENLVYNDALSPSNPLDRNIINGIILSISDRISTKKSITPTHHIQMLYGFPIKNINTVNLSFICISCQLLFQQLYQLECGHRKCMICLNIQKSCTTCSKVMLLDKICKNKVCFDQNSPILCFNCEWTGPLEAYQEHLKQNHHQLSICLVRNLEADDDRLITSLNCTCIWEASGINAMSNQRKSVYSSPFYIFPNGYKTCLRLFLNGDAKARNTHISLFLVLMKGNNDFNLQWPFRYKIKFTLFNHVSSNEHPSSIFWSNITSACFQHPRSNMNIAYGISKFYSLDLFRKNINQFVQNDTLLIKVEIDLLTERPNNAEELLQGDECVD